MEKMNNLRDLLKHEVEDLHSAEEQILEALPMMIENASNTNLKNALKEHLRVTKEQQKRLDQVMSHLNKGQEASNGSKKKGLLGLFGGKHKCKGMQGIIEEGNKILAEDMDADVKDAAIIASCQKVEHYEICGYGTARAYAEELGLKEVAALLEETLDEEYEADDKLTFLAESRINRQAENKGTRTGSSSSRSDRSRETTQDSVRRRQLEAEPVSARTSRREGSGRGNTTPSGNSGRSSNGRSGSARSNTGSKSSSRSAASKTASKRGSSSSGRSGNGRTRS